MSFHDKALTALDECNFERAVVYAILSLGESGLEPVALMASTFVDDPTSENFVQLARVVKEIAG